MEELWHYDMGLGNFGPCFRAVLQGEVNPSVLADEVVNPPHDIDNQNNEDVGQMQIGNDPNGMELLAEAAALNDNNQIEEMNEGLLEPGEDAEDNNMEVVIGLAAAPGENVEELGENEVQHEI